MNCITNMYGSINGKGALDLRLVASAVEKGYDVHQVHTCVLMWIMHVKNDLHDMMVASIMVLGISMVVTIPL